MIVVQQHCGGHFTPVYYPRKTIPVYLSQQAKTFCTLDGLEEIGIDFDTQYEFQIPFRTRILKYLKSKYECIVNKEQKYTLLLIPTVAIRFTYNDDKLNELVHDPHAVVWKDLIYTTPKVEKDLIHLLERVCSKQYGHKVSKKSNKSNKNTKPAPKRKYKKRKYNKKSKAK